MFNNQNVYFVSFANRLYASQKRIKREAKEMQFFDHIYVGDEKMLEPWYFKKYKDRWSERGFGYWQWKPYLIRRVMDRMEEGDYLVYADAGCTLNSNGIQRLKDYLLMVTESSCGVLGFDQHFREADWTKADLFDYFGVLGDSVYMDHGQVAGTCVIIQKKRTSQHLVDEWFYVVHFHHNLVDDSFSKLPNNPSFHEHRHDQSVFSILMVKYGGVELPVEEIFTEGDWELMRDFPIWATRLRMKRISVINKMCAVFRK
jgi:hypothetical protein